MYVGRNIFSVEPSKKKVLDPALIVKQVQIAFKPNYGQQ